MEHVAADVVWLLEQLGYCVIAVSAVLVLVCLERWVLSLWDALRARRGRK